MYQKCPICNGSGIDSNYISSQYLCKTCNGKGIISELTGLPPKEVNKISISSTSTDFRDNCEQFEDK